MHIIPIPTNLNYDTTILYEETGNLVYDRNVGLAVGSFEFLSH